MGDSRVYRLRRGELEPLTRDHSLILEYIQFKPDLTPEDAERLIDAALRNGGDDNATCVVLRVTEG